MTGRPAVFATALASLFAAPAFAAGTGMIFISNERSNTISVLNVAWSVPEVEVGRGVWATLEFDQPEHAWLRVYDGAPDALGRRCLITHRFPLKEPVHPVRSVFQRTPPNRLDRWAKRLYRLMFEPAAVW